MAKTDNLTDFMTDLANTIRAKKPNLTGPINAQNFSSEIESISGGTQPTLFAPTVTEGINSVAWSTNANNGGFNVTTVGRIDQTEVTSPLTITSAMDGKTLYITSSAENFNSSDVTKILSYSAGIPNKTTVTIGTGVTAPTNPAGLEGCPFVLSPFLQPSTFDQFANSGLKLFLNGFEMTSMNDLKAYMINTKNQIANFNDAKEIQFSLVVIDKTLNAPNYLTLFSLLAIKEDVTATNGILFGQAIGITSQTISIYLNDKLEQTSTVSGANTATINIPGKGSFEISFMGNSPYVSIPKDKGDLSAFDNGDVLTFVIKYNV